MAEALRVIKEIVVGGNVYREGLRAVQALENPHFRPRVLASDTEFGYYRKSRTVWKPFVKEISLVGADHDTVLSIKTIASAF